MPLALLLLSFVRPMIAGPTPLHMVEKPAPGTGATLMVDAISIIATGSSASVMVEGRDEDEWRKRLTAKLREIPSMLLIDNLRRQLDAPPWPRRSPRPTGRTGCSASRRWSASRSAASGSPPATTRSSRTRSPAAWSGSGSTRMRISRGCARASVIRTSWAGSGRTGARLVAACLTLGQAWIAAGMPRHPETIGSFEDWAQVMGGILDVAGVPGFLGNLKDMYERADAEGGVWRGFIALWWDRFGTQPVSIRRSLRTGPAVQHPAGAGRRARQADEPRPGARAHA